MRTGTRNAVHHARGFRRSVGSSLAKLYKPEVWLELHDFFSIEDMLAVAAPRDYAAEILHDADVKRAWYIKTDDERRALFTELLDQLELVDVAARYRAAATILYVMLGFPTKLKFRTDAVINNTTLMVEAGGLPCVMQHYLHSYHLSDLTPEGQQNLSVSLGLLYLLFTCQQDNLAFVGQLADLCLADNLTLIMKLFDSVMVCIMYPLLPVKKVLLTLRTTLRLLVGPVSSSYVRKKKRGTHADPELAAQRQLIAYTLYVALCPNLSRRVSSLLELLMAASPCKMYTGMVQLYSELKRHKANLPPPARMASGTRHRDIISATISELLLILMRYWKRIQPLQYVALTQELSKSIDSLFNLYLKQDLKSYILREDPFDDMIELEHMTPRSISRMVTAKPQAGTATAADGPGYESLEKRQPLVTGRRARVGRGRLAHPDPVPHLSPAPAATSPGRAGLDSIRLKPMSLRGRIMGSPPAPAPAARVSSPGVDSPPAGSGATGEGQASGGQTPGPARSMQVLPMGTPEKAAASTPAVETAGAVAEGGPDKPHLVLSVGRPRRSRRTGAGLQLQLPVSVPDVIEVDDEVESATPPQLHPNRRRSVVVVNILRLLGKLCAKSPATAHSLSKHSPVPVLKKCTSLKFLPPVVMFALRLLKTQLRYGTNWRAKHMTLVNAIYRHVPLEPGDKWMTKPQPKDEAAVEGPIRAQAIVQRYNDVVAEVSALQAMDPDAESSQTMVAPTAEAEEEEEKEPSEGDIDDKASVASDMSDVSWWSLDSELQALPEDAVLETRARLLTFHSIGNAVVQRDVTGSVPKDNATRPSSPVASEGSVDAELSALSPATAAKTLAASWLTSQSQEPAQEPEVEPTMAAALPQPPLQTIEDPGRMLSEREEQLLGDHRQWLDFFVPLQAGSWADPVDSR